MSGKRLAGRIPRVKAGAFGIDIGYVGGWAGKQSTVPSLDLLCDGGALNRNQYGELFKIIGTGYGAGNGTTTYNKPDKRGRYTIGGCTDLVAGNTSIPGTAIAGSNANTGGSTNSNVGGLGTTSVCGFGSTSVYSPGCSSPCVTVIPPFSAEYKILRAA